MPSEQTPSQRQLQQLCDKLFAQKFPVATIYKPDASLGLLWAITAQGFIAQIQRQASGHYWCDTISINSTQYDGNYHTDPSVQPEYRTIPEDVLSQVATATPMPTQEMRDWGVLHPKLGVTELLQWFPWGDSKESNKRPAAPHFALKGQRPSLSLRRDHKLDPTLFWSAVRAGKLVRLNRQQHLQGYFAVMKAPNGTPCVMLRDQLFARPEDWPRLAGVTTEQLKEAWSLDW